MFASSAPSFIRLLALAGTLPVVAVLAGLIIGTPLINGVILRAIAVYGAVIISFIAGAHWGLACAIGYANPVVQRHLSLSVIPALAAWAVAAQPIKIAFIGFVGLFPALLVLDLSARKSGLAPDWWMAMRLPPTLIMTAAYAATLVL